MSVDREESAGWNTFHHKNMQDRFLERVYGSALGRLMLKPFVSPRFSKLGGWVLDSKISSVFVKPFMKLNHICLDGCEKTQFDSFNDFFKRKMLPEARPMAEEGWIAPCDGRLSVYPIREDGWFHVKNTPYNAASLLKSQLLMDKFDGGYLWLFRLCVDDYHRYVYPVTGRKSGNIHIPGIFHTVNPVANDIYPIYKENTREYCLIQTKDYGTVLMMEVGALLVGKIENRQPGPASVKRGEEKGNFAFGGSTIILMTQKGQVTPPQRFLQNTKCGEETKVRMGELVEDMQK